MAGMMYNAYRKWHNTFPRPGKHHANGQFSTKLKGANP